MIDDARANDVRRLAASLQAIAKVLSNLVDGQHAEFVLGALRDPLSVRTSVERYARAQRDVRALQGHLAQMIDVQDHVVSETDLYDRFKIIDEQVFPRLEVKISQRNLDPVLVLVSSRAVRLRLRATLCECLLWDVWECIPMTVSVAEGAAAEISGHIRRVIHEAFVKAGRPFEGENLNAIPERFIENRVQVVIQDVLSRLIGIRIPGTPELDRIIDRASQQCMEGLHREDYNTDGLAPDVRLATARAAELVCDVARGGALLVFPNKGDVYDADLHEANDEPSSGAIVAGVTFPGLRRGERLLQRPQIITAAPGERDFDADAVRPVDDPTPSQSGK